MPTTRSATEFEQLLGIIKSTEYNIIQSLKKEQILEIERFSKEVKELFVSIHSLYNYIGDQQHDAAIFRLQQDPRINNAVATAKFALEFSSQVTDTERLHRMDLVAGILAGVGVIIGLIPLIFENSQDRIIPFIVTAIVFMLFARNLIRVFVWTSDIPNKVYFFIKRLFSGFC